jgi:hypothetical protein
MGLRGEAAVVIWGEMTGDAAEVDLWYAREHLQERLNVPGFLRARRCVRELGSPSYFMTSRIRRGRQIGRSTRMMTKQAGWLNAAVCLGSKARKRR